MPCAPEMNITPLPCAPGGGGSPGDIIVEGCCSPSIATSQLCLEDCSPISLVIRSGCTACDATPDDPEVIGYVDAAGAFTAGPPPAGAGTCAGCGDASPAEPCEPSPHCARLVGMSGPDVFTLPEGAESLTLSIICGSIEVTDCTGSTTVMNEGCGTLSWSAPQGGGCVPNTLCTPFTITVPEDSSVYIHWTEPC